MEGLKKKKVKRKKIGQKEINQIYLKIQVGINKGVGAQWMMD